MEERPPQTRTSCSGGPITADKCLSPSAGGVCGPPKAYCRSRRRRTARVPAYRIGEHSRAVSLPAPPAVYFPARSDRQTRLAVVAALFTHGRASWDQTRRSLLVTAPVVASRL